MKGKKSNLGVNIHKALQNNDILGNAEINLIDFGWDLNFCVSDQSGFRWFDVA